MRAAWWWIDRWRFSSAYRDMNLAEQGAYRNLLDECWVRQGPLPNDELQLAAISGKPGEWSSVRKAVMSHFVLDSTGWHNITVEKVIRESKRKAKNQRNYAARRAMLTGQMTDHLSGHLPRSLSPAEKNHPEAEKDAAALARRCAASPPRERERNGAERRVLTGRSDPEHGKNCRDPLCCEKGLQNSEPKPGPDGRRCLGPFCRNPDCCQDGRDWAARLSQTAPAVATFTNNPVAGGQDA